MNGRCTTGAVALVALGVAGALLAPGLLGGGDALAQPSSAPARPPAAFVIEAPVEAAAVPAAPGVQTVGATIPRAVLARDVAVAAGRLRTPVLLTDPGVRAEARLVGAPTECRAALVPATVVWLDCAAPPGDLELVVVAQDGSILASRHVS